MFRRMGILATLVAAAAMFEPSVASAQDRYDRHAYAYSNRDYDRHDRDWNRREDRDHERDEREWRQDERFEKRYDRSYFYNAPAYGYGYASSNSWRCW